MAKRDIRKNQVIALHAQGYRISDIAWLLGVNTSLISQQHKRLQLKPNDKGLIWGAVKQAQLIEMINRGVPVRNIAAHFGCGRGMVRVAAVREGLKLNDTSRPFTKLEDVVIKDRHQSGATLAEIAHILCRPVSSVRSRDEKLVGEDPELSSKQESASPAAPASPVKMRVPRAFVRKKAHPLEGIFHPKWCARDDHFILTQKEAGSHLSKIAQGLMRETRAVEQRWHKLRKIPNLEKLLEGYGLTTKPYPPVGA